MTITQHSELRQLLQKLESIPENEISQVFENLWVPYILSLETEDDKALAFKLLYEWQSERLDQLLGVIQEFESKIAA
ncbi:MAG TPA: hypothetical protein DCF33_00675 [Saprospirales bacterium]|nr:hypothetical protein [Saprospirales bacterium]